MEIEQLTQNIDKQIQKHQDKLYEVTMKQDKSKDVFSFEVPRYLKVMLSDGSEELAEVQSWNETLRLRRDMTEDEQKQFDTEYDAWKKEGKILRNYAFSDQEIRLIKYCLKTYFSDSQFKHIIDQYKRGMLDQAIKEPEVIEFINSFLTHKSFYFILLLPAVKTALSKEEYIKSINLADIIENKNVKFQPLVRDEVLGSTLNIFLKFNNLDTFRLAQLKLLNQKIEFEQLHLTEKAIEVFTQVFNQVYNIDVIKSQQTVLSQSEKQTLPPSSSSSQYASSSEVQVLLKNKEQQQNSNNNQDEQKSNNNQDEQKSNNNQDEQKSSQEEEITLIQKTNTQILNSESTHFIQDYQLQENENKMYEEQEIPSDSSISHEKILVEENNQIKCQTNGILDLISNALKIMKILEKEKVNFFISFKKQKYNSAKGEELLTSLVSNFNSCSGNSENQKNILKKSVVTKRGLNDFITYQRKHHKQMINHIFE